MYPISLNISGKLCVVIGGGAVAGRKVQGVLAEGGQVLVIAPEVCNYIREQAELNNLEWRARGYAAGDLAGACLVFAATGSKAVQEQVQSEAKGLNLLLNRADDPSACDFHVPASIHRGNLNIAVSTSGRSPAFAALVRKQLQGVIGNEYGVLLELVAAVRQRVIEGAEDQGGKRKLFRNLLQEDILDWIKTGQWNLVEARFKNVLGDIPEVDWQSFKQGFK